ncbi:DUF3800 domain-containing protein [Methylorubrum rhodesianum]|uniref:DUF3800 domain-containing protein n=1 Tax=Methylorubrum rhodesianum TaxID=29427 RepID=A0ABU9ZAC8_9HYPH
MEFRLFVDEFGNGDLDGAVKNPNVRFLALTGIIARQETHDAIIQPAIDGLKRSFFGHSPENPVVLHRREILRREGVFSVLRDDGKAQKFNDCVLAILRDAKYLAITVQIDKKRHFEHYGVWRFDPYHYCLHCLVERYIMWLNAHGWRGDVMIEARSKSHDKKLKGSFQRLFSDGTEHIPVKDVQKCLIKRDIIMKPKSANIAGLQIADLLVHPSARHMRFDRERVQQPDDFGTKIANILIDYKYRRHPESKRIDGFGRKWLPY